MNILHIALASAFTENMTYQENYLIEQNLLDGHNVTIITDCHKFIDGRMVSCEAGYTRMDNGAMLIRLEYDHIINSFLSGKIRRVSKLKGIIEELKPNVILFHGLASWELYTVTDYKKKNPDIKLYADSHADYYTSATNGLSKYILHGIFYRKIIQDCLPFIDMIFYISVNCGLVLRELYHIPIEKMEFYPLGGTFMNDSRKTEVCRDVRERLMLKEEDIFFIHAGKLDKNKKTLELMEAFSKVKSNNFRLGVIGSIAEDIKFGFECALKKDERILYLGWKSSDEIMDYLNACNIYIQPGKVSALAANAICAGAAVILKDIPDYQPFVDGNGWLINDAGEIPEILDDIKNDKVNVREMQRRSEALARECLDYNLLSKRMYL